MKKILKRILLGTGILIALIVIFFVGYMLKAKSEIKKMTPTETKEITANIFSIQDSFTNMYFIKDSASYIAIDAGNNIEVVAEELKKLNIDPDMFTAVLLTHTDGDHVAAIKLFKKARIYLSKQEEQLLTGEKYRFLFFGNTIDADEYTLVADQEIFSIGNIKIQGILTPGHTIGSMCYFVDNKYLFVGDALSLKEGKVSPFNRFFNTNTKIATKSMGLITNIPEAEFIFTAHYGYTDDYKTAVQSWE